MENRKALRIAFFSVAAVLALAATLIFRPFSSGAELVEVAIPPGTSAAQVSQILVGKDIIDSPALFKALARVTGASRKLYPGIYTLSKETGSWKALRILSRGHAAEYKVTFPEGWTAQQIAQTLELNRILKAKDFLDEVYRLNLEGYLYPNTYYFRPFSSAQEVVARMLSEFNKRWTKEDEITAYKLGLTRHKVVILASIVEREAKVDAERPMVAAVFLNRLKKGWRLESCATVQYALGVPKDRLLYKDLEVDSPYNTYRNKGLTPGPIGNPGWPSIEAVLHPATTDALFFVAEGTGTHRFTKYLKAHQQEKRALRRVQRKVRP